MVERKNGDRVGIWFGYWWVYEVVSSWPAGHSLVTLFFLSVSVKDRPLHKAIGKSQTYYPEHIHGYGRLENLLLSCHGSDSFRTDYLGGLFLLG